MGITTDSVSYSFQCSRITRPVEFIRDAEPTDFFISVLNYNVDYQKTNSSRNEFRLSQCYCGMLGVNAYGQRISKVYLQHHYLAECARTSKGVR
jgi:hypothetical protein